VGLGWPQEQEKLDLRTEVDAVTMMWPLGADEDGIVYCEAQLELVPDKRYRDGQRPVRCGVMIGSLGSCLSDAYDEIELHRKVVKHHGD
jgi:hypothetical protein